MLYLASQERRKLIVFYGDSMDYLIRGLLKDRKVRFLAVRNTDCINEAISIKKPSDVVIALLGRTLAVGSMMGYMNKEDDMIPSKTLSAIIYDATGEPILEFPIITFEAPHSIFRAMVKEKIGNDITSLWNFGKKSTEETYKRLTAI